MEINRAHPSDPHDGIKAFAGTISKQQLGVVLHSPEPWAIATNCFANVWEKVRRAGGRPQYGWTFCYRLIATGGGYLLATHHAVWHAPGGEVIDVTPFHENPKHQPITSDRRVLFLVDDAAQPVVAGEKVGPLPLRFFALGNDAAVFAHVESLQQDEEQQCRQLYGGA